MPVRELGVDARRAVRRHHAAARADGRRPADRARGRPDHRPADPLGRRCRGAPAVRSRRGLVHPRRDPARPARARRRGRRHRLLRGAVHARLLPHRGPSVARLRDREGVHVPRADGLARPDGTAVDDGRRLPSGAGRGRRATSSSCSTAGSAASARPTTASSSSPTSGASSRAFGGRPDDPLRDRDAPRSSSDLAEAGGDVIGVDHRVSLADAWRRVGYDRGVQGNLDAARLLAGWEATEAVRRRCSTRPSGRPGHVFNLGHGVLPDDRHRPAPPARRLRPRETARTGAGTVAEVVA